MIIIPEYNRKENMKYCQGPRCHTYDTQDRKRGPKGNKVNQGFFLMYLIILDTILFAS